MLSNVQLYIRIGPGICSALLHKYLADLQVKSEIDKKPVIKTMVQNQTITIQQKLFQDLQRFAAYRQRQPHTRKTGVSASSRWYSL